jgi:sterol desaturase/sphingolipid hydroxylase (fatty acid hydroxylase superfamily)
MRPQPNGKHQLFSNPILERFTRTHIAVPVTIFILYAVALAVWNVRFTDLPGETTILLFFVGWLTFTWVEYQVHRHVFHLSTYTTWRKNFQYVVHGVHHHYPKDKDRLAMPPLLSITIATVLLIILKLVLGDYVFAFLPGFLVGYASYLLIHYMVHAYAPPKNVFKALWKNHSVHHYKDCDLLFGVSSPLWDYIYGTIPKPKNASKNREIYPQPIEK